MVKKFIIRIIIAAIIVLLVILISRNITQEDKFKDLKSLKLEDNSSYKYTYDIKVNSKEKRFCYHDYDKCDKKQDTIKVESNNIEVLDNYKNEYLFYKDNKKLKMYSSDNKKTYVINMPDKYSSYSFVVFNSNILGIIYEDNKLDGFYSFKLNKHLYTHKYNNISVVNEKYLSGSIYADNNINEGKQTNEVLLSINEEKELLNKAINNNDEYSSFYFKEVNNYIVLVLNTLNDQIYKEIYNSNLKLVYKTDRNESYTTDAESFDFVYGSDIGSNGNIYVYENGFLSEYDKNGSLVKKSSKIEDVVLQIKEYVVMANENISLVDINLKETLITEYKPNMLLRSELSSYDEKEKAIVFVIEEDDLNIDELFNECQKSKLCSYTKDDFKDAVVGHSYYYYLKSKNVVKTPTIIPSEDNPVL